MRTKAEIARHVAYWSKKPASEVGLKVADLLDEWDGLHHFDDSLMKKVDWTNRLYIEVKIRGGLATFDFNQLTRLVFLAHDHCIRVDISPCNPQYLKLTFHPRKSRDGGMCVRHPTLEETVVDWRNAHSVSDWLLMDEAASAEKATDDLSVRERGSDFAPILPIQGEGAIFR